MKNKFTPGPWTIETQFKVLTNVHANTETRIPYYDVGSDLRVLATVQSGLNDAANAQLIAAAPEMLEALETAAAVLRANGATETNRGQLADDAALIQIVAAIGKARGQ